MATAFVDMIGAVMILPLLPFYADTMGAGGFVIGVLISAFSIAQLASAPIWADSRTDMAGGRCYMRVRQTAGGMARVAFPWWDGWAFDHIGMAAPFVVCGALTAGTLWLIQGVKVPAPRARAGQSSVTPSMPDSPSMVSAQAKNVAISNRVSAQEEGTGDRRKGTLAAARSSAGKHPPRSVEETTSGGHAYEHCPDATAPLRRSLIRRAGADHSGGAPRSASRATAGAAPGRSSR